MGARYAEEYTWATDFEFAEGIRVARCCVSNSRRRRVQKSVDGEGTIWESRAIL